MPRAIARQHQIESDHRRRRRCIPVAFCVCYAVRALLLTVAVVCILPIVHMHIRVPSVFFLLLFLLTAVPFLGPAIAI